MALEINAKTENQEVCVTNMIIWLKRMGVLLLLGKIAAVDDKYKVIPNEYLLLGILLRGILLILEMTEDFFGTWQNLFFDLTGSVVVLGVCLLSRILSKNGIGMGDVKLLALLPFWLGMKDGLNVILFAFCIFFVQAIYCVVTKKKDKKDRIPFGPAVFAGMGVLIVIDLL